MVNTIRQNTVFKLLLTCVLAILFVFSSILNIFELKAFAGSGTSPFTISVGSPHYYGGNFTTDFVVRQGPLTGGGVCIEPSQRTPYTGTYYWEHAGVDTDKGKVFMIGFIAMGYGKNIPSNFVNECKQAISVAYPKDTLVAWHLATAKAVGSKDWAAYGSGFSTANVNTAIQNAINLANSSDVYKKVTRQAIRVHVKGKQDLYVGEAIYKEAVAPPVIPPTGENVEVVSYDGDCRRGELTRTGEGDLIINKSSSSPSDTDGNPAYDLSPVTFNLSGYGVNETKRLDSSNSVAFRNLTPGTYTLTEVNPGKNYEPISSRQVEITADTITGSYEECDDRTKTTTVYDSQGNYVSSRTEIIEPGYYRESWSNGTGYIPNKVHTIDIQNVPRKGSFELSKITEENLAELVDGNKNYDLSGAVYELKHKHINRTYTLTTDAYGKASVSNIPLGSYTLTEKTRPRGYALNTEPVDIEVKWLNGNFNKQNHKDEPVYDFPRLQLVKVDDKQFNLGNKYKPQGDMKLEDAIFHVKMFEEQDLTESTIAGKVPIFEFDAKTILDNNGQAKIKFDKNNIIADSWRHKTGRSLNDFMDIWNQNRFNFPLGTFYISEVKAPEGYTLDHSDFKSENTSTTKNFYIYNLKESDLKDETLPILNKFESIQVNEKSHIKGKVKVAKFDDRNHNKTPQGDAKLKSTFKIYNRSKNNIFVGDNKFAPGDVVETIVTDDASREVTCNSDLPYGTYELVEESTDKTYNLVPYSKTFEVREDGKVYDFTQRGQASENSVKRGGLVLQKYSYDFMKADPEGDGTLAGAEFTIINRSKEAVWHPEKEEKYEVGQVVAKITTNEAGVAQTLPNMLPIGTYEVFESKPSEGYLLNKSWKKIFKITEDHQIVALDQIPESVDLSANKTDDRSAIAEDIIRGGLILNKSDKDRIESDPHGDETVAQGDTVLSGAEFTITNKSKHKVKVDGKIYEPNQIVKTIVTDKDGVAKTDDNTLPYGTYEVRESKAPEGYFVDKNWSSTVKIRVHKDVVKANTTDINPVKEQIFRSGFMLRKIDAEKGVFYTKSDVSNDESNGDTKDFSEQGDATLEGAVFDVYNDSALPVYVNKKWVEPGQVCATFETDKKGIIKTSKDLLPYGTYHIVERTPSNGYLLNSTWRVDFKVREDNRYYNFTSSNPIPEQVIRGDVQIQKFDLELDKSEALGGKDHKKSEHGATLEGIQFEIKNVSKKSVYVDGTLYEQGQVVKTIISHWNDSLKTYTAETTNKALPYGTYEIRESMSNKTYNLTDQKIRTFEIREDGKVVTVDKENNTMIFKNRVIRADLDFKKIAENKDPMSTLWLLTNLTTGEEHILASNSDGEFSTSNVKHSVDTNINDGLIIRAKSGEEIKMDEVKLNHGVWFSKGEDSSDAKVNDEYGALMYGAYRLKELKTDTNHYFDNKEFTFFVHKDNDPISLGEITNIKHEINTEALGDETGLQLGAAKEKSIIRDKVNYRNAVIGDKYTLKATLIDKESGATLVDKDGNELTGKTVFRASSTTGSVDVLIPANGYDLTGKTVVVFEEMFDVDGNKVAEHTEIEDEKQTVYFPNIKTTALGVDTHDHDAPSTKTIKIVDRVRYSNLIVGKEYTMSGVLMNQATNKPVLYKSGREVRQTKTFTPNVSDGYVDLEFEVDGDILQGETVVAFETLKYKNVPIAVHTDIEDENQSVHFPKIRTTLNSELTEDHDAATVKTVILNDKVAYNNLLVGKEYVLKATLMNKKTGKAVVDGDGREVVAEKKFIPATKDGFEIVTFELNAENLKGVETVAFERLYRKGIEVAIHTDINDENQTVRFPKIGTTAVYKDTNLHEGLADKKTTIVDSVKFFNLIPGKEYTMSGVLMDKDSNSPMKDKSGKVITSSVKFTPKEQSGVVNIVFTFDASLMEGKTVVAFETLSRKGKELTTHSDINDEAQTVRFPKIRTTLVDKSNQIKLVKANSKISLVDTVKYENLTVGVKYRMSGRLVFKPSGDDVTSSKVVHYEFTPVKRSGEVRLTFEVDTNGLEGKTLVAFEKLQRVDGNIVVAVHEDIEDEGQTVYVPKIRTKAHSVDTGDNEGALLEKNKVVDTVKYHNLIVGKVYEMQGTLMNKKTGKPLVRKDGSVVTSKVSFTADKTDGEVKLEFEFDSRLLEGETVVAFEKLYHNGILIGVHEDIEDEYQSVHYPKIRTKAAFVSGINEGLADKRAHVIDTIKYENLKVGNKYTIRGTLVDKITQKNLIAKVIKGDGESKIYNDKDGSVVSEITFVADKTDGEVQVEFIFDASELSGKTFVVFEDLIRNNKVIAYHRDIDDKEQTVYFPKIGTSLRDKDTNSKQARSVENTVLIDTVKYENLNVGETYTMKGVLMDKLTGKPIEVGGREVVGETTFKADKVNGSVDIEFKVDARELEGKIVVAFERLFRDGNVIAVHEDIEDEEQTVYFPVIKTTATDSQTKSHQVSHSDKVEIIDVVKYNGLIKGKKYKMSGILMDKSANNALVTKDGRKIASSLEFTPERESGEVEMKFVIENADLAGKTLVVFERLELDKKVVATHEDIEDKDQSVYAMNLSTYATALDKANKQINLDKKAKVNDKITYENLIIGEEYTFESVLKDAKTGEVIKMADNKDSTVRTTFVPKDVNGVVEVVLEADTTKLQGKTLVVTQKVFDKNGVLVGLHDSLDDKNQQVVVKTVVTVNTGVKSMIKPLIATCAILTLVGCALYVYERRFS